MISLSVRDTLTKRERETLLCTVQGLSTKETARKLGCGKRTVEDYRRNIFKKYKARNAVELVRAFYGLDEVDKSIVPSSQTLGAGL